MHIEFLCINMKGRDHREGPGRRYEEAATCFLKKEPGRAWVGLIWFRKGHIIFDCRRVGMYIILK
jgi:hypothetical protein